VTRRLAPWLLLAAFLIVYVPDVGHGFLRDDFSWIRQSRVAAPTDVLRLFGQDNGFFRPVVALTFAADQALWGLRPLAFALTNVALLLAAAAALARVGRALGLAPGAALLAAALWAFNPHAVPMALLWISGRTSILLSLFSLLAALAFVRGRRWLAGALCLVALLSKEEAILLPFILLGWEAIATRGAMRARLKAALRAAWPCLLVLVPYFALRSATHAYLPQNAPSFYRPTFDPAHLARNVAEYADRAGTVAVATLLVAWLAVRRRPRPDETERAIVARGLVWLVLGFALTVFVPVRSSLYALFPSIGSCLAAAALAQALWREASAPVARWAPAAALVVPFALVPIYHARALRWVHPADVSTQVLEALETRAPDPARLTLLVDTPDRRLAGAFGTLLPEALELHGLSPHVCIDPPPPGTLDRPMPGGPRDRLVLRDGRLVSQLE
jgi:hypothetical protein